MVGLAGGRLLVADIHSARRARLDGDRLVGAGRAVSLRSETCTAGAVTVASDASGAVAAAVAYESLVNLTNGATKRFLTLGDGLPRFWGLAASADGARFAVGREGGLVELRDPRTLAVERTLDGLQAPVLSLAFSPDGRWLAGGDDTTRLRLWDLDADPAAPMELGGLGKVVALAWLDDGSGLVAVGLTRHLGVFRRGEAEPAVLIAPGGFGTRYFIGGALVAERFVVVPVEDTGLLVADLRPR
jgi:hypothetical protein